MTFRIRYQQICLFFCFIALFASCTPVSQQQRVVPPANGTFSIFLQPLPQEAHRLTFSIEDLVALTVDDKEIKLPLSENRISDQLIGVQKRLANLTLPPGRYQGIALRIASASLAGEDGPIDLLAPKDRVVVETPFTISEKQSKTLFLSLSSDRLVTDGVFFTPKFSLWEPDRLLTNLKGFVCNSASQNLTVFNKHTSQVVGHLQVGKRPVDMVLDQQHRWLYVALAGEDAVAVVEVANGTILGRVPLRFGDEPSKLALTANGKTLLALNVGSETVSIIDTGSLFETARIRLHSQPSGIFLQGSAIAYVTHKVSSSLSILDLRSGTLQGTVVLEAAPLTGVSDEAEHALYLINDFSPDLTVLNSSSLGPREKVFIGDGAVTIRADKSRNLLYIGKQDGEIAVVDPRSLMAIDSFSLPSKIQSLTIDGEENALFAVLPKSDQLVKIDLVSKRVLGRLQLDSGSRAVVVMGER